MKLNGVLLICAVLLAAAEAQAPAPNTLCTGAFLMTVARKCTVQHGITQADFYDSLYIRPAASVKAKCFRACIFDICQAFNADGSLVNNIAQMYAYLMSRRDLSRWSIAEEAAASCVKNSIPTERSNICETAESFLQCVRAKTPADYTFLSAL